MNQDQFSHLLAISALTSTSDELKELLNGTNFVVEFAGNGNDGLKMAEEILPVAILVDIDGHSTQGFETCRRLRASRLLVNIPIIMLSYREERDARAAGLSAGADDFIEKPFDALEVYARLRTVARLSTYRAMLSDLTRFSWMVEHAQEGYLMLDKAGAIHYANERAQHLLNITEDYLGLPFMQMVERLYLPEPAEAWGAWLEDPAPCFLVQPESPTARAVWVVIEALDTPMGAEHQRIVRLRDVTERMSIYQDMRKFHTVVAHKLRTPMSIMYTNLNLVKKQIDRLTPEEIREFMRGAIAGTDRLAAEIRQILTYIDAPLALNVGQPVLLEKVPEITKNACDALEIKNVLLSMPEDLRQLNIALTPDALEMILLELLGNARKFHPEHNPNVEISISKDENERINLRVADDGINLSAEQLGWAWLPYFQGEKDFTGEVAGMGLGFPMVATLVWKSGGSVRLRNQPNSPGIIVDIKIPLESTMRSMVRNAAPYKRAG